MLSVLDKFSFPFETLIAISHTDAMLNASLQSGSRMIRVAVDESLCGSLAAQSQTWLSMR